MRISRIKKQWIAALLTLVISTPAAATSPVLSSVNTDELGTQIGLVYFAPKSAHLSVKSQKYLDAVIVGNPNVSKITVVGYSQWAKWATPSSYERVSLARANAVQTYMQSKGVTVEFVTQSGGLPEKNGKNYKARRAEIYAQFNSSTATATSTTSSNPTPAPSCGTTLSGGVLSGTDVQLMCELYGADNDNNTVRKTNTYSNAVRVTEVTTNDPNSSTNRNLEYILSATSGRVTIYTSKENLMGFFQITQFAVGDRLELSPVGLSNVTRSAVANVGYETTFTYTINGSPFTRSFAAYNSGACLDFTQVQGYSSPSTNGIYEVTATICQA